MSYDPKTVPLIIILFAAFQTSNAQDLTLGIEKAERMWMSAIADGDRIVYDELLTEDFTWTYISGRTIGREVMIEAIGPVSITETDKKIRIYENSAIVTGLASLEIQGRPVTEQFVRIWIRGSDGKWILAFFQATEID